MGKDKKKSKKRHYEMEMDPDNSIDKKQSKKLRKQAEKVAKAFGYTNDTNPFGDSNLLEPFVWGKKKDKDRKEGKAQNCDDEENRLRLMKDIDRVRKRRVEREQEVEEMERLRAEEQRLKEAAQYENWEEKEDEFHTQQTKVRSKIRLVEKREKPIDILARHVLLVESFNSVEQEETSLTSRFTDIENLEDHINDPLTVIEELDNEGLRDLLCDLDKYVEVETKNNGSYIHFWKALKDVTAATLRQRNNRSGGLHKAVKSDVKKIVGAKVSEDLKLLLEDIRKSIREGKRSDIEYWEHMEQEVANEYSRAIVREVHQDILRQQLEIVARLRAENDIKAASKAATDPERDDQTSSSNLEYRFLPTSSLNRKRSHDDVDQDKFIDDSAEARALQEAERSKGLEDSEEAMVSTDEVSLQSKSYHWQDKYRPRKPRYFNKVKTGFDWNKYNQTHYDFDSPPPKIVQGYKFNIFYPDLIDNTSTPKYFLEGCDEPEYAILRFHSGPPYEDIAFKIVNQEWMIGRKSGFRCTFERGILQLHFNFKRRWYRR